MKRFLRAAGILLTLLALVFVAWSFSQTGAWASEFWKDPRLWLSLGLAAIVYGLALNLIAIGWAGLVAAASDVSPERRAYVRIYAISQLFKYLPGNVMHYVGRQAMLRERGVEHSAAAWGSLTEAVVILAASFSVALLTGASVLAGLATEDALRNLAIGAAALGVLAIFAALAVWCFRARFAGIAARLLRARVAVSIAGAYAAYGVFFVLSGAALWLVLAIGIGAPADLAAVIATASASWAIGFLTPGASAGIGIREALIIAALTAVGGAGEQAAIAAIAYRIATTLGDLLFVAGASWLCRPAKA